MTYQARLSEAAATFHERMFPGYVSDFLRTDAEFIERFDNFAFGEVIAETQDVLDERTRNMCWLATLLGCQGTEEYRGMLPAALRMGVEPEAAKEIVYQAVDYLGIGRVFPFLKITNEVFETMGIEVPLKGQATTEPTDESRKAAGEAAQVAAFGESMRGYYDRGNPDYPHINQWLVKNCFGDFYSRGGLTIAERELATFCFLAAQGGCEMQLRGHVAGNMHCGNDPQILRAVASSNLPFIGYPRTLNALAIIDEVATTEQ